MAISTQRRSNVQRRRESIEGVLKAALDQFVHRGYTATSTADIAAAAGLTKGSVYHYFEDKLALILALLDQSENTLYKPAFEKIRASSENAQSQLVMFVNWVAKAGAENKELMLLPVLVSLEFFEFGNEAERRVTLMYDQLRLELERIVCLGQKDGSFNSNSDPQSVAVALVALVDGLLLQWYRWGKEINGPQLAREARTMILQGLKPT